MRILFIAPRYHTNQHGWVKALQSHRHDVGFVVQNANSTHEHHELLTPRVVPSNSLPTLLVWLLTGLQRLASVQPRNIFSRWPNRHALEQEITDFAPDIVIVRDVALPLSLMAYWITKRRGYRTIHYSQRPLEDTERWFTRLLQLLSIVPPQRITPVRRDSEHEINDETGAAYTPLVVDFPFELAERSYCPDNTLRLLCIGKFTLERKQHLLLLKAINKLKQDYAIELTLIGSVPEDGSPLLARIKAFVSEHGLEEIVTIRENVPYEEITEAYAAHDIFVLPSTDEPFSVSTLEAMAHGLPAIVTDTNGSRFCVTEGQNGTIVQGGSVTALRNAIATFAETPEIAERFGHAAHETATRQHSTASAYAYFKQQVIAD